MKKRILYILFLLIITPLCFEGALRIMGYTGFTNIDYSLVSSPKNCLVSSNDMGLALADGSFNVTINEGHSYKVTHRNGERITSDTELHDSLSQVFMMGCSYTYGMGVEDDQNFVYLLQQGLPNYNVRNFGVPGFGTVQSYLQIKREIENGTIPEIVIINYCDFHSERNSLLPSYRRNLAIGFNNSNNEAKKEMSSSRIPYMKDGLVAFENWNSLYKDWSGRETFAMINYLQSRADRSVTGSIDFDQNNLDIFLKIKDICAKNNIRFVVNGLLKNQETKKFLNQLEKEKIETLEVSLDLTKKEYNNLPYDSHPNKEAHANYAKTFLSTLFK
ncbi:MAG: hypothetical protein P8H56_05530 [Crocinitomicaceae bacterium]|nr:hypothetical protein [Crocinitomicaceae bacterium]MDG1658023.1 hypothetical protein [Crocinitomicaceae bacterium]